MTAWLPLGDGISDTHDQNRSQGGSIPQAPTDRVDGGRKEARQAENRPNACNRAPFAAVFGWASTETSVRSGRDIRGPRDHADHWGADHCPLRNSGFFASQRLPSDPSSTPGPPRRFLSSQQLLCSLLKASHLPSLHVGLALKSRACPGHVRRQFACPPPADPWTETAP